MTASTEACTFCQMSAQCFWFFPFELLILKLSVFWARCCDLFSRTNSLVYWFVSKQSSRAKKPNDEDDLENIYSKARMCCFLIIERTAYWIEWESCVTSNQREDFRREKIVPCFLHHFFLVAQITFQTFIGATMLCWLPTVIIFTFHLRSVEILNCCYRWL